MLEMALFMVQRLILKFTMLLKDSTNAEQSNVIFNFQLGLTCNSKAKMLLNYRRNILKIRMQRLKRKL